MYGTDIVDSNSKSRLDDLHWTKRRRGGSSEDEITYVGKRDERETQALVKTHTDD